MDARQQKGLEIAATMHLEKQPDGTWSVPSQTLKGRYAVDATTKHCTCPDFELRQQPCKHVFAVEYVIRRETVHTADGDGATTVTTTETAAVRVTYGQDWPNYNRAQTAEKELFCHLLRDLCAAVPEPERAQTRGRPRIPVADALFSACFKVYSTASCRRFMTDLREAQAHGFVERPWHFNTVLKVIEDQDITARLHELVAATAAPLRAIERTFAVDSTGFGTQRFYRHYTAKYGHDQYAREWLKLHALIGIETNIIAAARITERNGNDAPEFKPLLEMGRQQFTLAEVCADKAYASRDNVATVTEGGGTPYIALRSNVKEPTLRREQKPNAWEKLFYLYNYRKEEFLSRYHQRSNAESTFSALKRVFGDTLRNRTVVAQINELLLKVIAYNIVCVVHSIFELGVTVPGLSVCTQNAIAAHKGVA
jgi:transposase